MLLGGLIHVGILFVGFFDLGVFIGFVICLLFILFYVGLPALYLYALGV